MSESTSWLLFGAAILRIVAETMKGDKNKRGWLFNICASLVTVVWSINHGDWGLAVLSVAMVLICVRGWVRWGRIQDKRRLEIHELKNELHTAQLKLAIKEQGIPE